MPHSWRHFFIRGGGGGDEEGGSDEGWEGVTRGDEGVTRWG